MTRPIGLILDTSAMAVYGASVDLGETMVEAVSNGVDVGLPILCLAEVAAGSKGDHRVAMLVGHRHAAVLPALAEDWPTMAAAAGLLGDAGCAAAFIAAEAHDCWILTGRPEAYAALGDDPPVIGI